MNFSRVVRKIPVFRDLSSYQVQQFLGGCTSRTYKAGELLCRAGEASNEMFILISGALRVTSSSGVQLTHISPAEIVGEMGFVTNMPRCATITAATNVNVLVVGRGKFNNLLKEDADMGMKIYHNLLQAMIVRLRENNKYITKPRKEAEVSRSDQDKRIAASTL